MSAIQLAQPPANLCLLLPHRRIMTKTNIERTLETLVDFADIHRQSLSRLAENIEALTVQTGTFSENLTRVEIQIERLGDRIEQLGNRVERIAGTVEQQSETARIQAETVARLALMVEQLIARN